jgi:transposase-like protein
MQKRKKTTMEEHDVKSLLAQEESKEAAAMLRGMLKQAVRQALYEVTEEEIEHLCGPKHARGESRDSYRAGTSPSRIFVEGRPEAASRPRVRRKTVEGSVEVHLKSWKAAQDPDEWEEALKRAILCGVSTRGHERLHESELKGLSKSSISRLWQRKAAELVEEMLSRDFSEEPIVAVMLDGVFLADNLHAIVALGIRQDGTKVILGFRVGTSENVEVCRDLMSDLVRRGVHVAKGRRLLAVLDGSTALKRAVLEFFPSAVIQRCLVHKERNLRRYLPQKHWSTLGVLFSALRKAQGVEAALQCRERIAAFLADKNKAARESFDEAGEELLAFQRLGAPSTLNITFLSTNCIENAIRNLRRHIGRVCRWRHESDHPERWLASGLILAEKGFRKVRGYRDLPSLMRALQHEAMSQPSPDPQRAA